MPTPGPIRKEILTALEDYAIPALWQRTVALGCVALPWRFPVAIQARLLDKTVPRAEAERPDFPFQTRWMRAKLHCRLYPYFGFIYEGIADERTLVSTAQAKKYNLNKGIYALRWQAPSVLLWPPGTPHNADDTQFWQEPETPEPTRKILWFSMGQELLLHTHQRHADSSLQVSHSLQINDPTTLNLASLFITELKASADEPQIAEAILLALLLRLQKKLSTDHVPIANTSRSPLPLWETVPPNEHLGITSRDAAIFIQMHLHEPLTLNRIAQQVSLSPAHLNRIFQRFYSVSIMRYVRQQRIVAAKKILHGGSENIAEIATLVGFKRASGFCDVFRRETGLTPNQFRRRSRRGEILPDLQPDDRLSK